MQVHKGWAQYTADTIDEWFSQNNSQPTTSIDLSSFFFTSAEVLNSVLEGLAYTVDQERGLSSFGIAYFYDRNTLQEWPLRQLAIKCHNLQHLKLY